MRQCDTLIRAGIIITQDEDRNIINDGGIAICGGKIAAVGPWQEIQPGWYGTDTLDLQARLVMPGLINGHTHAAMTFLRGLADDMPLMTWLTETIFPVEARLTREIVSLGSLLGYAEMLATGTTACVDMYIYEDAVLEAADVAGIRCLGGEAVFQFPSAACPDYRQALAKTAELAEKYVGHERINVAVNPHSIYTTSLEILAACRDMALDLALPLHIHLAETEAETRECLAGRGMRPVAWCERAGLFEARVIAAHLVDINAAEASLLAAKGATGCHNPSSNMKLASGAAPVWRQLQAGLKLGLGTDGPASNNQLNMFLEMGRAALLHKLAQADPAIMPAQTVLDMATLGGAHVLADPSLGRLAPGSAADLIALDLTRPNMQPLYNPVSQVVYAASGQEVTLTMVAGEIVYRDGGFTRIDYPALLKEVEQLREFALRKGCAA